MSAKAAVAKSHKCARCPETDLAKFSKNRAVKSGLHRLCKACSKEYQRLYYLGVRHVPIPKVTLICDNPTCGKKFTRKQKTIEMHRKEREAQGNFSRRKFCSRSCASQVTHPHGVIRRLKVRKWRSNEQQYWEQVLHEAGLGEERGINHAVILYGLDRFVEGVDPDGSIRIVNIKKDD
jgi:hypothetical protein